jgi:hypothetical protein
MVYRCVCACVRTDWLVFMNLGANIKLLKIIPILHEGVSKSFRTGRLKPELQMIQLSATRCSLSLFCESV